MWFHSLPISTHLKCQLRPLEVAVLLKYRLSVAVDRVSKLALNGIELVDLVPINLQVVHRVE